MYLLSKLLRILLEVLYKIDLYKFYLIFIYNQSFTQRIVI